MHLAGRTYEEAYATFRWEIPDRFNIAAFVCDRHAARNGEAVALTVDDGAGGIETWTASRLDVTARRLANAFVALGVARGVIVAIHLPQGAECALAHIAVQKCGGIALPLFNLFGPEAVRYRLADSGARVLLTTADGFARLDSDLADIETLKTVIVVGVPRAAAAAIGGGHGRHLEPLDFQALVERASDVFTTADTGPDDPAILMYTSGTTGQPKGVLHAGRVVLGHLPGVMVPHDFLPQPGDRFWTPADWAWAGGLLDVMLPSLFHAVPLVASRRSRFDPEWAFDFLARHGIRNVFMPPTALRLMRAVPDPRRRFGYDLRSVGTGGESAGADLIAWGHETFGLTIAEFYGQTECNLVVANCPSLFAARPGSMGRAVPGHVVEVIDEEGHVLPPGQPGQVAVRRPDPVLFLEYWKRPEATAAKFIGDWCTLGDVAVKDADGHFWYQGRDDDLINSAGYRIGPGEVEDCLMRHPAVALAGVVGAPDAIRGEVVAAFVVVKPGYQPGEALRTEIQAHVREQLAAHEYPRLVEFLDELPMTVTGKVRRVDLRGLLKKPG